RRSRASRRGVGTAYSPSGGPPAGRPSVAADPPSAASLAEAAAPWSVSVRGVAWAAEPSEACGRADGSSRGGFELAAAATPAADAPLAAAARSMRASRRVRGATGRGVGAFAESGEPDEEPAGEPDDELSEFVGFAGRALV